jgi:hypothetical protein
MRLVEANLKPDEMRVMLSMFKTHCAVEGSMYEFNHFKNWLKKNHNTVLEYENTVPVRIDM